MNALLILFLIVTGLAVFYVTMRNTYTWFMIMLYRDKFVKMVKDLVISKK